MYLVVKEVEDRVLVRGTGMDREVYYSREYIAPHLFPTNKLAKAYIKAMEGAIQPKGMLDRPKYTLKKLNVTKELFIVERQDGKVSTACFSEQEVKEYLKTKKKELYTVTKLGSVPESGDGTA